MPGRRAGQRSGAPHNSEPRLLGRWQDTVGPGGYARASAKRATRYGDGACVLSMRARWRKVSRQRAQGRSSTWRVSSPWLPERRTWDPRMSFHRQDGFHEPPRRGIVVAKVLNHLPLTLNGDALRDEVFLTHVLQRLACNVFGVTGIPAVTEQLWKSFENCSPATGTPCGPRRARSWRATSVDDEHLVRAETVRQHGGACRRHQNHVLNMPVAHVRFEGEDHALL
jgi:hypothetical protein